MKIALLASIFCLSATPAMAQNFRHRQQDTIKVFDLLESAINKSQTDVNEALTFTDSALRIARILKYRRGLVAALTVKGNFTRVLGKPAEALSIFREALHISEAGSLNINTADILNGMANTYDDLGDYKKALTYFQNAAGIYRSLNDTLNLRNTYANTAIVLQHMTDYQKANEYYEKAIHLSELLGMPVGSMYAAMGGNLIEQKQYRQAFDILFKGRGIADTSNDAYSSVIVYMNIGLAYDVTGKMDSALYYYLKAEKIADEIDDVINQSTLLNNIGTVYIESGNFSKAGQYLMKSLKLAKDISHNAIMANAYINLSELYAKQGNYQQAYNFAKLGHAIKDTLLSKEKARSLADLTISYETREIEQEKNILQKKNAIQQFRIKQQGILLYGALLVVSLVVTIAFLFWRQNKLLSKQQRIELAHKQLYAQMNPHFIFNCLGSIQNFILKNDTKNANRYLTSFASLMRQTLENSKTSTITLREELKYIKNYLSMEHLRFENKFSYEVSCESNIDLDAIEIPPMMVQPFAENAIAHGLGYYKNGEGYLSVRFYLESGILYCEVDDNGIGRQRSQELKEQVSSAYRSQGMEVTRERLELVSKIKKADYSVTIKDKTDGNKPAGTLVIIKFPVVNDKGSIG
jgi:tetratricopeptide (TPR) repeat protein